MIWGRKRLFITSQDFIKTIFILATVDSSSFESAIVLNQSAIRQSVRKMVFAYWLIAGFYGQISQIFRSKNFFDKGFVLSENPFLWLRFPQTLFMAMIVEMTVEVSILKPFWNSSTCIPCKRAQAYCRRIHELTPNYKNEE